MSQQLKVLLRKEFRRQGSLVVAAVIFVGLPYVVTLFFVPFHSVLREGAAGALFISCLLAGFFAGNSVATERPSRSIEFLTSLPVPRRLDLSSRLAVAGALGAAFLLMNLLVVAGSAPVMDIFEGVLIYGPTTLGLFGISWLASTIFRSAVISTTAGLAVIASLVILGMHLQSTGAAEATLYWQWDYPILSASLGMAGLIAGSVYHLKRKTLA